MPKIHEVLGMLNETRKVQLKQTILREQDSDVLRFVLRYALDPLKHFHIRKLPWVGAGNLTLSGQMPNLSASALSSVEHHNTSLTVLSKLLDRLSSGSLSGQAAINVVQSAIESLTYEDGEVFKKILKKDLRCGIKAKTVNNAFGYDFIPIFGCMLASTFKSEIDPMGYYMSIKYDGLRGAYRDGVMYTRNGHKVQGVEHITSVLRQLKIESLDGELLIPGEHFQVSSGQIRSHKPSHNAIYYVFDTAEQRVPFIKRLQDLDALEKLDPKAIKVVKHVKVVNERHLLNNYDKSLAAGYEGLVIKSPNHLYSTSRSKSWLKMKAVDSLELTITGLFEGEGKFKGMTGGCICDYNGTAVRASSSRLTDEDKRFMWLNPDNYIDKHIEVLYHEITATGSLRHPRIKSKHTRGDL